MASPQPSGIGGGRISCVCMKKLKKGVSGIAGHARGPLLYLYSLVNCHLITYLVRSSTLPLLSNNGVL